MSDGRENFDLLRIQDSFLHCVELIRDATNEIFSHEPTDNMEIGTLKNLISLASSRSQAVCFLLFSGYIWDAEIILRSFTEACSKIWFICYRDKESRKLIVLEFWEANAEAQNNKTAQRAETARNLAERYGLEIEEQIFAFLQREDIFSRSDKNKAKRRELEQKWSFSEILNYLENDAKDLAPLKSISSLAHMYGMQSHVVHSDNVALDLMHDHATREPEVRRLKEISHVCRVLSDVCSFWIFSLEAIQFALDVPQDRNAPYWKAWKDFHALSEPAKHAFYETQKEFYKSWSSSQG